MGGATHHLVRTVRRFRTNPTRNLDYGFPRLANGPLHNRRTRWAA